MNTAIHYTIFLAAFRILGVNYLLATTVGYCAGVLNSFLLNKKWTFKAHDIRSDTAFIKFVLVNLAALLANIAALKFTVQHAGLRPEAAQLFAIAFSTVVNFLGNKLWTFQRGERESILPVSNVQRLPPKDHDFS